MLELENTYLLKEFPKGFFEYLEKGESKYVKGKKEIIDIYLPIESKHPKIRIRKNGEKYEITKKFPLNEGDASVQKEQTINLTESEFNIFNKLCGKKVHKIRYLYDYNGKIAEIDIFMGDLKGLIVVDFEFIDELEKNNFVMPSFCLADITQEEFIAGGMIAGKKYSDLNIYLEKYGYKEFII
ncbi:MAG: hypothetical protein PHS49_02825 [Candidatus Gracilibacteria bacterium]|nr:hypothetical protein [Candidatus Gracilibacteria bacterium]